MRLSTPRWFPALGRTAPLAGVLLLGAPALAQDARFTDIPSPSFRLDEGAAARPVPASSRKARAARPSRTAAPKAAADGAAPGTIPMDFSGMARRGADLDRNKEGPDGGSDNRPVTHNGMMPGATFKF